MIGKRVVDDLYLHLSSITELVDEGHRKIAQTAIDSLPSGHQYLPNVVKLNLKSLRVSLLSYPGFDDEPFPELIASWTFQNDFKTPPVFRSYASSLNRPILHRKELLLHPNDPRCSDWRRVTEEAEALGLFDEPTAIGFRQNWDRLLLAKGYCVDAGAIVPIGNDLADGDDGEAEQAVPGIGIQRHLTALVRTSLSAPVQLLLRHGLISEGATFFDYGCGRGGDVSALKEAGFEAEGWDPHYAPANRLVEAHVVNLGFVINVIEDPAERVDVLRKAFSLTQGVLAVSVMLYGPESQGRRFSDGIVTSRQTFQKYFSQSELRDFLEHALHHPVYMAGPGVAFVFKSGDFEQRYCSGRYRTSGIAERLLYAQAQRTIRPARVKTSKPVRVSAAELKRIALKPVLDRFWRTSLELGRWPELDEVSIHAGAADEPSHGEIPSIGRLVRLIQDQYDLSLLEAASRTRADDLRVFFAAQHFEKRPAFKQLENRLQRDVKTFFGDYKAAQVSGFRLLQETAEPARLLQACQAASEQGLGWLDGEHSLQVHIDLIERLPAVLRAYVTCGLVLWNSMGEIDLVKIHINSGKLTLLQFDDFDNDPLPSLQRRVKVNLRKLDYDLFEYGSPEFPCPTLLNKSRFMHEDQPGFVEQQAFDAALEQLGLAPSDDRNLTRQQVVAALSLARRQVAGMMLLPSDDLPPLDQACGSHFTYRSFCDCGETQNQLRIANLPKQPQTFNALYELATRILDPVIEYFGAIRLTYGFCSASLAKKIPGRIAPELDQHAGFERNQKGNPICSRGGAACDFIVEDEDMSEVADWIIENLDFDRLYYYGSGKPIHVSIGPENSRSAYELHRTPSGRLVPRPYRSPR